MRLLFLLLLVITLPTRAAVILLYHHIATDTPPSTTTTPKVFASHLQYLHDHGFHVVALADAIAEAQGKTTLPPFSVAITFDDGYQDIADNAAPLLAKYGYPFTVFVNRDRLGHHGMMSLATLKALPGVTFANHTASHQHLTTLPLAQARQSIVEGQLPGMQKWLAWPYGEYSPALEKLAQQLGYVAFGQQSGASGPYASLTALPRFPAAGRYANLETLTTKLRSLAMPLTSSDTNMVQTGELSPALTLTIHDHDVRMDRFACYFLGNRVDIHINSETVTLPPIELPPGRSRVNCTALSRSQPHRYYWWSQPWLSGQPLD